jgi:DNA-binding CsgD family transcriptional regulator
MVEEYRRHWTFEDCRREPLLTIPVGCPAAELTLQVPSPELISRDLAITAREAELAALLAAGHNLHSAAQRLKVSGHTARGQLKSIFRKTGLHTQAELIRRIALGPASSRVVGGGPC